MTSAAETRELVQDYYGRILKSSGDLKTSACRCSTDSFPATQKEILKLIEPEILEKFYGCGSPLPAALETRTVLDLGCGTGRDVYLAAKLVGPRGRVIGIDMTAEQLEVARRHVETQTRKFGFASPNVTFEQGYIEDLRAVGIADNSVDVVISNCVINLSPDKPRVFAEIFRVIKPGGELYFADVYASRRIPPELREDPRLYGECLSGALYREDLRRLLRQCGCADAREMTREKIEISDPEMAAKLGPIEFYSITIRAFKLAALEDRCEDYGQIATYRGTIADHASGFALDDHHYFETGKPMSVCGNTASMLQETRFGAHFAVSGDRSTHYGLFDCGPATSVSRACC